MPVKFFENPKTTGEYLLNQRQGRAVFRVFEPETIQVVIGQSNCPDRELNVDVVSQEGIPVLRRKSGGGAVVLDKGMLVSHVVVNNVAMGETKRWVSQLTELFRTTLLNLGVLDACVRGGSDLCVGDKKVLGSSVYRNQTQVLYQNVLLVSPDLLLIDRYLKHPSREPHYRNGRPHLSFVSSLKQQGYSGSVDDVAGVAAAALMRLQ